MRKMKDSGIEWIGEIPEGWEVGQIGQLYSERRTKVSDKDYPPLSVTMKGILPQLSTAAKTDAHDDRKLVCKGDFAINSRSDRRGSCGISEQDGSISLINTVLQPRGEMNPGYYNWLFHTSMFADEFYKWGHGIVDDLWTTGWSDMKKIGVPVPSKCEQKQLAEHLNVECSHIDSMLSKTRSSIEEYKKLKQAVITQAVTKGVRGEREMKDSGVEWISEIPANWTVKRGKQLFSETNERSETGSEELLTVSHITGVTPRSQKNVNMFMSESLVGYKICHNGDLAANTMWMWQGAIGVSKFHGVISPSYNTYRQKTNDYYFEYLDYLLRIRPLIDAYTIHSTGITLSRLRLYPDSFLSLYFIVPPITEQKEIADYLDAKCAEIDKLIAKKEQLVKELESYKKILIYEVVTGKREV